jgi:hypothetical protein
MLHFTNNTMSNGTVIRPKTFFRNLLRLSFSKPFRLLRTHIDAKFYMSTYLEVINSGLDPIEHYLAKGCSKVSTPVPTSRRYITSPRTRMLQKPE